VLSLYYLLKNDDSLYEEGADNDVYFEDNDESTYKHGFINVVGRFRIVFGFSANMTDGIFELEELVRK
jgi:hypothetical protein